MRFITNLIVICMFAVLLAGCASALNPVFEPTASPATGTVASTMQTSAVPTMAVSTTVAPTTATTYKASPAPVPTPGQTQASGKLQSTPDKSTLSEMKAKYDANAQKPPAFNPDPKANIPSLGLGKYKVADKPLSINCESFILNIDEGTVYSPELPLLVGSVMTGLERITGLKFNPEGCIYGAVDVNIRKDIEKPFAFAQGITVTPYNMLLEGGYNTNIFIHELSHTLLLRNCETSSSVLNEGFAVVNESKIGEITSSRSIFDCYYNYSNFPNEGAMLSDPEKMFLTAEDWDKYVFGFRLSVYLEKTYGADILPTVIKEIRASYADNMANPAQVLEVVKSLTSADLFSDFKKWHEANKDIFSVPEPIQDFRGYPVFDIDPILNTKNKAYARIGFIYCDTIDISFKNGFGYLQHQGYNVCGIFGTIAAKGKHTLSFYNSKGELISERTLEADSIKLEVYNAVIMRITGDGSEIQLVPDFMRIVNN